MVSKEQQFDSPTRQVNVKNISQDLVFVSPGQPLSVKLGHAVDHIACKYGDLCT